MSKTTKDIVIMAQSDIGDRMAETAYGTFETVGAAELHAQKHIKITKWRIAHRVVREEVGQETETTHQFLTAIVDPRQPIE